MGATCCCLNEHTGQLPTVVVQKGGKQSEPTRGRRWIFQLGASNWHTPKEPASASGHLHEAHHMAYNAMDGMACYSVYPSAVHDGNPPEDRVAVVRLPHAIPNYEAGEGRSWKSMSNREVEEYIGRLENSAYEMLQLGEEEQGCPCELAIAHHAFLTAVALHRVAQRRLQEGSAALSLAVLCDGAELALLSTRRWRVLLESAFASTDAGVQAAILPSEQVRVRFCEHFPTFPLDRTFISQPGYNPAVFYPQEPRLALGPEPHMALFAGAEESLVLRATGHYSTDVLTVVLREGEVERRGGVLFMPAQSPAELAGLYSAADVCVLLHEAGGSTLALKECLACGTPVVGVVDGLATSFLTEDVGALVPRAVSEAAVGEALGRLVAEALSRSWKKTKAAACLELCRGFSVNQQCWEIVKNIPDMVQAH